MIRSPRDRHPRHPSAPRLGIVRPSDWLDACCWGCGTEDVAPQPDGRLLCAQCRADLLEPADVDDGLRFTRRSYWESHSLVCCWRCLTEAVSPEDQLGLCPPCREQFGAP